MTVPGPITGCIATSDGIAYCGEVTRRERAIERNESAGLDTTELRAKTERIRTAHVADAIDREAAYGWLR